MNFEIATATSDKILAYVLGENNRVEMRSCGSFSLPQSVYFDSNFFTAFVNMTTDERFFGKLFIFNGELFKIPDYETFLDKCSDSFDKNGDYTKKTIAASKKYFRVNKKDHLETLHSYDLKL
jgi:hypothetical protein